MMNSTNYSIRGKSVSYEVVRDGYDIYLDGKKWIKQREPNIPHPELGYKGSCIKQIEELVEENQVTVEESGNDTEDRLQALEEENAMLSATLDDLLTNIIPAMTGESEVM